MKEINQYDKENGKQFRKQGLWKNYKMYSYWLVYYLDDVITYEQIFGRFDNRLESDYFYHLIF